MAPEVDEGRAVGDDEDLELAVVFAVRMGVAAEMAGAISTTTAGESAEALVVADVEAAGIAVCVLLDVGSGPVINNDDSRFVKTNTTIPTRTATATVTATNLDRLRGGGVVWTKPPTVATSISSFDSGAPERIDMGSRNSGFGEADSVLAVFE
jgi:hypothetical protein